MSIKEGINEGKIKIFSFLFLIYQTDEFSNNNSKSIYMYIYMYAHIVHINKLNDHNDIRNEREEPVLFCYYN